MEIKKVGDKVKFENFIFSSQACKDALIFVELFDDIQFNMIQSQMNETAKSFIENEKYKKNVISSILFYQKIPFTGKFTNVDIRKKISYKLKKIDLPRLIRDCIEELKTYGMLKVNVIYDPINGNDKINSKSEKDDDPQMSDSDSDSDMDDKKSKSKKKKKKKKEKNKNKKKTNPKKKAGGCRRYKAEIERIPLSVCCSNANAKEIVFDFMTTCGINIQNYASRFGLEQVKWFKSQRVVEILFLQRKLKLQN